MLSPSREDRGIIPIIVLQEGHPHAWGVSIVSGTCPSMRCLSPLSNTTTCPKNFVAGPITGGHQWQGDKKPCRRKSKVYVWNTVPHSAPEKRQEHPVYGEEGGASRFSLRTWCIGQQFFGHPWTSIMRHEIRPTVVHVAPGQGLSSHAVP